MEKNNGCQTKINNYIAYIKISEFASRDSLLEMEFALCHTICSPWKLFIMKFPSISHVNHNSVSLTSLPDFCTVCLSLLEGIEQR